MSCLDIKWFIALLGLIAFTNANAFSRAPNVPEDMPAWRIGYAMSTLYPAEVTQTYGVNDSRGWTSFIHNDVLFFGRTELKEMRKYAPNYDGYSIALGIPVAIKRQVMPTNVLPDRVYLYWASITNQRFFLTQFNITQKLKREMMVKRKFLTWDEVELDCYEKDIIFGFLPNGNTKVWLDGCAEYKFVTELEPIKELDMDSFGNDAEIYRINYGKRMAERAKQLGATLDPIPWNKVNKVFSKEEITKLD